MQIVNITDPEKDIISIKQYEDYLYCLSVDGYLSFQPLYEISKNEEIYNLLKYSLSNTHQKLPFHLRQVEDRNGDDNIYEYEAEISLNNRKQLDSGDIGYLDFKIYSGRLYFSTLEGYFYSELNAPFDNKQLRLNPPNKPEKDEIVGHNLSIDKGVISSITSEIVWEDTTIKKFSTVTDVSSLPPELWPKNLKKAREVNLREKDLKETKLSLNSTNVPEGAELPEVFTPSTTNFFGKAGKKFYIGTNEILQIEGFDLLKFNTIYSIEKPNDYNKNLMALYSEDSINLIALGKQA